ncbi:ribose operon transcriptional repressor RbsR [Lonsdalea britannica]|nr:ribose operon transcriptional repressor RbsR [Lonsdalea britannica]
MATMKDVARVAGVSTSTVSHVINGDRFVSEAVREKVLQAVKQLNYAPSALARSLKINQTRTIGMLLTASSNPFYAEVVRGVERSCYERGYSLILCNTEGDPERMSRSLETLLQKRVDGLLLMCSESSALSPDIMRRYPSLPTVMMDWAPFEGCGGVIKDNSLQGGEIATRYLITQGYRRIACITGPLDKTTAHNRLEGYRKAMDDAGLPRPSFYEVSGDFEFASGYQAMQQLLRLELPPEAVFACNDAMAVGVYRALHQAGLSIPEDVAVMGYDDIELARYLSPPLTTIQQPKDELGELAIDTLLYRMTDPDSPPNVLTLTPELAVRESVGKYRNRF